MSHQMCLRCADPLSEGFGVLAKAPSSKRDFQPMFCCAGSGAELRLSGATHHDYRL